MFNKMIKAFRGSGMIKYVLMLMVIILAGAYVGAADETDSVSDQEPVALYTSAVDDQAGLFTQEEEQRLLNLITERISPYAHGMVITLSHNPFGQNEEDTNFEYDYCMDIFNKNFESDDQAVFLLIDRESDWLYLFKMGDRVKTSFGKLTGKIFDDDAMLYAKIEDFYHFSMLSVAKTGCVLGGELLEDGTVGELDMKDLEGPAIFNSYEQVNEDTGYRVIVEDQAGLLEESKIDDLIENALMPLTEYTSACVVTITENPFGYSTYDTKYEKDYCSNYYDNHFQRINGEYENCVIFLVDMDARWLYLYREGPVKDILTEDLCDTITDNVYSHASDQEYYKCFEECFDQVYRVLNGQKIAQPMKTISNGLIALCGAFFITFLIASFGSRANKASDVELLRNSRHQVQVGNVKEHLTKTTKVYTPPSSSSSGGGGHSGGGGGGGSHGGGGGHRF